MRKILISGIILASILAGIVFAQENPEVKEDVQVTAQDLEVSEPKILPGNPLYFLKDWIRGIQLALTFNKAKKAELKLKFANEKLVEVERLVELKRNPKLIEKVLNDFQNKIGEIAKESGENLKQFSEKLIHQQILHQKILERLEKQVPPEVFEKIKAQREKHLEKFAEIIQKVEEKAKIPERLEKELEKIKGSKFKDFKNLEILDEIKEKMPQDVKQKIEEKKAQIIEKFREKLEGMTDEEKERFKNYLEQIPGNKLKHLEIISNLEGDEISDTLREKLEKAKERKIDEVAKEVTEITANVAQNQIKKAEDEIKKAEEKVSVLSEDEYGGKAARELLNLAKKHLDEAKKAFDEGKYGRAFGLATAAYHEALNAQRIVEKIEEINRLPEKKREKMEKLFPGVELPKDISECKIQVMLKCPENEVLILGKDARGCPIYKCQPIKIPQPIVCPMIFDPVCGKDGKTYSNECFAKMAGVEIDYKGVCKEMKPEIPKPKLETPGGLRF